ncbi:hypothetical protein CXG81DRAFT_14950 [Caulochytrium protostelioides]|uniref:Cytochrome P450 n=1 Tax=Caulochytrium protostelioides TaxID=1555241 RepID=A0A4P9WW01_9FUNG|nr:cytochrome P450 [Caulochytrium protostelioides]RKO99141.1 hypothetical protein CXG81DRAFT_14950 [Caulochytrium protostelioides]|eukprot:RKO99141.1 hypothetical protein CXG81DRAFT_14950 [Caulochytrium protostelioides]
MQFVRYRRSDWFALPGDFEWPLIGNFIQMYGPAKESRQFKYISPAFRRFGPIFRFRAFGTRLVFLADPEAAKIVFTSKAYHKGPELQQAFVGINQYGLPVLPDGATWKRHRRNCQPAFSPASLRLAFAAANKHVDHLSHSLRKAAQATGQGTVVMNLKRITRSILTDVMGDVLLSHSFGRTKTLFDANGQPVNEEDDRDEILDVKRLFAPVAVRMVTPSWMWRLKLIEKGEMVIPRGYYRHHAQAENSEETAPRDMVKSLAPDATHDMLDRLIETEAFDDEELIDEIFAFMLAGHDTTASALLFLIFELASNTPVRERLLREIAEVVSPDVGAAASHSQMTYEHLSRLPYLDCVIKELFRVHPVTRDIVRTVREPTVLMGYKLPVGTTISVQTADLNMDPRVWKNPKTFDPDRFADGAPLQQKTIVFGIGQHVCIGEKMAIVELKAAVVALLRQFTFRVIPGQDIVPINSITTTLVNGLMVEITPL